MFGSRLAWLRFVPVIWIITHSNPGPLQSSVIAQESATQSNDRLTDKPGDEALDGESSDEEETRVAYERFLSLLMRQPKSGTALDRVYGYHVERGTLDEFTASLQSNAAISADNGVTWMLIGLIELQRSHDTEAAHAFRKAESVRPKDPLVSWYLGRSLVRLGDATAATQALERALVRAPEKSDRLQIFQELGRAYRRSQQPEKSATVWKTMEEQFPNDVRVKEQIATILQQEGDFEAAIVRFTELATLHRDPYQAAQSSLTAGELKMQLGRNEEALKDFERQLSKLDPESWLYCDARRRIEDVFRRTDDLAGLVAYYERWLKTHPEDLDAMSRIGRALAIQGRFAEARKWFSEALKLAPSNIAMREAMIEQLIREELYAEAILQYEQLSLHDNGDADHIEEWGLLYLNHSDLPQAERQAKAAEVWQLLVKNRTDDAAAVSRVADLLRRAALTDEAIRMYRRAISIAPNEPQYREYLGDYLHSLKRTDEAIPLWNSIAEGKQRTTENLVRLAEILKSFGHGEEAINAMRDACTLTPAFAEHVRFARMLREFEKNGSSLGAKESLEQLDLAERLAESAEDRQLVLDERIKSLRASGLLKAKTQELATDLQIGNEVSSIRWRTLAMYFEADSQLPSAIEAINKSLALEPDSVATWTVASNVYEEAGRLADAVIANRRLAVLDRRFLTEYLRKTATLEQRLGRSKEAQQAGKELLAAAPGNPEHSQFYADLCFQAGQKEEGLKTLRRAVRANASDDNLLMSLAAALAKQGESAEAIDLYWRAFEGAANVDARSSITTSLAELHLQTNQFDRLVQKLEQRGKERNQQRDSAMCLATAFRIAGDLKSSRQRLEGLLTADSRDVTLLEELAKMAETEGDLEAAADYQRRINTIAPSEVGRTRLANLLFKLGDISEAEALLARVSEATTAPHEVIKALDQLIEIESFDPAKQLCVRMLERDPKNWEILVRLGILEWQTGHKDKASECFDRVLALELDADTPSAEVQWSSTRKAMVNPSATFGFRPAGQGGIQQFLLRGFSLGNVRLQLGETSEEPETYTPFGNGGVIRIRSGASVTILSGSGSSFNPMLGSSVGAGELYSDYGCARIFSIGARYLSALEKGDHVAFVQQMEKEADQSIQSAWDTFYLHQLFLDGAYPNAKQLVDAQRLAEKGDLEGQSLYLLECGNRIPTVPIGDDLGIAESSTQPPYAFTAEQIELMISSFESILAKEPGWTFVLNQSALLAVCRQTGTTDRLQSLIQRLTTDDSSHQQLTVALELAIELETITVDEALAKLDRVGGLVMVETGIPWTSNERTLTTLQSIVGLAGKAGQDSTLQTLSWWLERKAKSLALAITANRTPTQPFTRTRGNVRSTQTDEFDYPRFPGHFSDLDISLLRLITSNIKDSRKVDRWCDEQRRTVTGRHAVLVELATSSFFWWDESKSQSTRHLIRAVELAPDDTRLRLQLVALCEITSKKADALALLEQPPKNDPELLRICELKALDLAMAVGNKDRARLAAGRLCGLQLDPESAQLLMQNLAKLGMDDRLAEVKSRLATEQNPSVRTASPAELLDHYEKQGNTQAAVQVARQLIRRLSARPAPQPGRGPTAKEAQQLRERAYTILNTSGELEKMIDRQKSQLEKSPNSKLLLQTLLEYQDIAGHTADAVETRKRLIALQSSTSIESLLESAKNLEAVGRQSHACDKYLELMRRHPVALDQGRVDIPVALFIDVNRTADLVKELIHSAKSSIIYGTAFMKLREVVREVSEDSNGSAAMVAVLNQIIEAYPEQLQFYLSVCRTTVWHNPELLPILEKLYIPASEADVQSVRFGWPTQYSGQRQYFGVANNSDDRAEWHFYILSAALTNADSRTAIQNKITETMKTRPDWAAGELLLALVELQAAQEATIQSGHSDESTFSPVEQKIRQSLDRHEIQVPEVVAFEVASYLVKHPALKPVAIELLQRSILQTPYDKRSLGSPAAMMIVRLFEETEQFEQGRAFVRQNTPSDSDPRLNDARRSHWIGSRMAAAQAMASLKDSLASLRLLEGLTAEDEAVYLQAMLNSATSRSTPRQSSTTILESIREAARRRITARVIAEAIRQDGQTGTRQTQPQLDLALNIQQRQGGIFHLESPLLSALATSGPSAMNSADLQELASSLDHAMHSEAPDDSLIAAGVTFILAGGDEPSFSKMVPALKKYLTRPIAQTSRESPAADDSKRPHERQLSFACILAAVEVHPLLNCQSLDRVAELMMNRAIEVARQHPDQRYLLAMLYQQGAMLSAAGKTQQAEQAWSEMLDVVLAAPDVHPDRPMRALNGKNESGSATKTQSPKVDIGEELRKMLLKPTTTN